MRVVVVEHGGEHRAGVVRHGGRGGCCGGGVVGGVRGGRGGVEGSRRVKLLLLDKLVSLLHVLALLRAAILEPNFHLKIDRGF